MKTIALLSLVLAVAFGLPFEQKEAQAPLPEVDQRPLLGDLLPVQGHVVVENPAPQPQLRKELHLSDKKEHMALHDQKENAEVQINEFLEDPQGKPDLVYNNKIAQEKTEAPVEDKGSVWVYLEPNSEITENVEQDKDSELNHQLQEESHKVTNSKKYDFEQPIMQLEPLINEDDLKLDELLHTSFMDNDVYEEPAMFLEPEGNGAAMGEEGPMLDALGEPFPSDEEFMRLETEEQFERLSSVEQVVHGRRSCSGVVLQGKCFQFFSNAKKAAEAEFFCQESFPGGHLASITSPNIHDEVMALMRQNGGTRRTWVGGIRFLDTGRFVWLDGSRWSYADWLQGEPNNTANLEDCVEVLASGKFNDFTCWEPQAFICSYPYQ